MKYVAIPKRIREIPNLHNIDEEKGYKKTTLQFLYSFRVLVCTVGMAGKLAGSDLEKGVLLKNHDPKHFSYVFIDEAGNATEPATLIPIMGKKKNLFGFYSK